MAGTGAIAHGRNQSGDEARASGMGWITGDEGSGYWMARRGLEAVAREMDGAARPPRSGGSCARKPTL